MPASLYREHFQQPETAASYVETYDGSTYDSLLWQIERDQLAELVSRHAPAQGIAVDCATGTGRVLQVLAERYPRTIGVDSSLPMLEVARRSCTSSELVHADLLEGLPMLAGEDVAVLTSFRLLLNIDPDLRRTVLDHFRTLLKGSPGAVLIVNNHGNTPSIKSVGRRRSHDSYSTAGNLLADGELRALFAEAGFDVVEVAGCGVLGGKVARLLGTRISRTVEMRAARSRRLSRFAINQLFVLKPAVSA